VSAFRRTVNEQDAMPDHSAQRFVILLDNIRSR
jgi:hypothetical protein